MNKEKEILELKVDGIIVLFAALLIVILDGTVERWRKKFFNKIIREIKEKNFREI